MITTELSEVGLFIYNLLDRNSVDLGLSEIMYGDQVKIPTTPAACVETGSKTQEYNGAPRRVQVTMEVFVILYLARVGDKQENRMDVEDLAEQVETLIHQDSSLGGLVIYSLVNSIVYGYDVRGGDMIRAARLSVTGASQGQLPSAFS